MASPKHIIKNTKHLVEYMEWIVLKEDEMLVSFDVKSLFTSIPVSEASEICELRLWVDKILPKRTSMDVDTIMLPVRFCLNNTSFLYGDQPYQQLDGVAMGVHLSPVIADIFMVDLEKKAIAGAGEDIAPSVRSGMWTTFSRWRKEIKENDDKEEDEDGTEPKTIEDQDQVQPLLHWPEFA